MSIFKIENKGNKAKITINDQIGKSYDYWNDETYGYDVTDFAKSINEVGNITQLDIYITTIGGKTFDGWQIVDAINGLKAKGVMVNTHAIGLIASFGVSIYLLGDTRTATKHMTFMVHGVSGGIDYGSLADFEAYTELLRSQQRQVVDLIVENTNYTEQDVEKMMQTDTWIDGERALADGIVTKMVQGTDVTNKLTKIPKDVVQQMGWQNVPKNLIQNKENIFMQFTKDVKNSISNGFDGLKKLFENKEDEGSKKVMEEITNALNLISEIEVSDEENEENTDEISNLIEEKLKPFNTKIADLEAKNTSLESEITNLKTENESLSDTVNNLLGDDPKNNGGDRVFGDDGKNEKIEFPDYI